jgi:regulator of sirC expression with transglutaminase-like and TPR domain
MIEQLYGGEMPFRLEYLSAVTKKQILTRMLQNLKGIYAREQDHARMLGLIERALLVNPEAAAEIRDRGLAYLGLERYAPARADLETYLRPAPDAADAPMIRERIAQLKQQQARLN